MQGVQRWLVAALFAALGTTACSVVKEPGGTGEDEIPRTECELAAGRVTLHRLNRTEYNNTVRDLLGVDLRPADRFPQDDLAHGFDNIAEVLSVAPLLVEKYDEAARQLAEAALADGSARAKLIGCDPSQVGEEKCAREALGRFVSRAWRRPVSEQELEKVMGLYRVAITEGEGFDKGIQLAIQGALVSPNFIFRFEEDPPAGQVRRLGGYELASRLSYFLWSTMPDDQLFFAAESGLLETTEGVEAEVERMLADPRAQAFVSNFGGQWLATRALERAQPDPASFPDWDDELREAMGMETQLVLAELIEQRRPLTDLLDADFTYVNERLARHYGIEGVKGAGFQRVPVPENRGGILAHGSFLTTTSNPTRTSPVKRGKWVLGQLLCDEPPPPPPGVEGLPDTGEATGTLREQMEAHRTDPICASCHVTMDSIGFGLENFGPTGTFRTKDESGYAIDASGELPGGRIFEGAVQLAQTLKQDPKFASCMAEQAMTFALGRALTRTDDCSVESVAEKFAAGNYTFESLAKAIATSEPFRLRAARKEEGK